MHYNFCIKYRLAFVVHKATFSLARPYYEDKTYYMELTLLLLNTTCPVFANSVDPDQLASSEANWSGPALFVIKYVNFYKKNRIK